MEKVEMGNRKPKRAIKNQNEQQKAQNVQMETRLNVLLQGPTSYVPVRKF